MYDIIEITRDGKLNAKNPMSRYDQYSQEISEAMRAFNRFQTAFEHYQYDWHDLWTVKTLRHPIKRLRVFRQSWQMLRDSAAAVRQFEFILKSQEKNLVAEKAHE